MMNCRSLLFISRCILSLFACLKDFFLNCKQISYMSHNVTDYKLSQCHINRIVINISSIGLYTYYRSTLATVGLLIVSTDKSGGGSNRRLSVRSAQRVDLRENNVDSLVSTVTRRGRH